MKTTETTTVPLIQGGRCRFRVWAPEKKSMTLHIVHPYDKEVAMEKEGEGYFTTDIPADQGPLHYFYRPDEEKDYPDPSSPFQPQGVHGPSAVVDHAAYLWNDMHWKGISFDSLIFYELHVGTFTPEGTFEAIILRLDDLVQTGINAIELMPVAQFPGNRNWGYDGVYPYAVQHSYGGPEGLKKLVDACHRKGIAVFLDVVYNHLGPEGNYFSQFAPYFTDRYRTPWGNAINFDDEWADGVRDFFSNNAVYWFEFFHLDGLRLDAIHAVFDTGAVHFWELLHNKVKELEKRAGRPLYLVAESDLNDPRVVKSPARGGYGFSAQWLDDFHHALYVLIDTKGKDRFYDFGTMHQLVKAYTDGFVHTGEFVRFRKKKFGASSAGIPGDKFVVFNTNHDQAGNRAGGERLGMLVDIERVKLAAAALLLSPYIPLLFMGEEYGEDTPFYYFVSHSDPELVRAVREGRENEFRAFNAESMLRDPQDEKTFLDSVIHWEKRQHGHHRLILDWHKALIALRRTLPALREFEKTEVQADALGEEGFVLFRKAKGSPEGMLALFNLSGKELPYIFPSTIQSGQKILDSGESRWTERPLQGNLLPAQITGGQRCLQPGPGVAVYRYMEASSGI